MTTNEIIHDDCRNIRLHLGPWGPDRKIDCIVTDPPFGVDVKMNSAESAEQRAVNERIDNDGDFDIAKQVFLGMCEETMPLLADDADVYIFTSWHVLGQWDEMLRAHLPSYGLEPCGVGVWDKGYPGKGDLEGRWGFGFEYIFYYKKGRRLLNGKRRNLLLAIDKEPSGANIHPTQKPVALMGALIEASTDPGDLVVDPFSGSGATSVAAQRSGRDSLAFETDERFIAPSRDRLSQAGLVF